MTEPLPAGLATALDSTFPDATVASVERLPGGETHDTHRVAFADREPVVVKRAVRERGHDRIRRETAVLRYLSGESDLPVPIVFGFDLTVTEPFVVTESIDGATADDLGRFDPDDHDHFLRAAGRTLGRLHETATFDAPGVVQGDERGRLFVEDRSSWPGLLVELTEEMSEDLLGSRFEAVSREAVDVLHRERDALALDGDPRLIHCDYGPQNVFEQSASVVGVVDWEWTLVGDPVYDLARAEFRFLGNAAANRESAVRDQFYGGYRDVRSLPDDAQTRRDWYRGLALLGPMTTFDSWSGSLDVPAREAARTMREELRRWLDL